MIRKRIMAMLTAVMLIAVAVMAPAVEAGAANWTGSTLFSGKEATDPNGEATEPNGEATDPNGEATEPNGEATDPDGEATDPDGEATDPNGSMEVSGTFVEGSQEISFVNSEEVCYEFVPTQTGYYEFLVGKGVLNASISEKGGRHIGWLDEWWTKAGVFYAGHTYNIVCVYSSEDENSAVGDLYNTELEINPIIISDIEMINNGPLTYMAGGYEEGPELDLIVSDVIFRLTYEDGTSEDVAFGEWLSTDVSLDKEIDWNSSGQYTLTVTEEATGFEDYIHFSLVTFADITATGQVTDFDCNETHTVKSSYGSELNLYKLTNVKDGYNWILSTVVPTGEIDRGVSFVKIYWVENGELVNRDGTDLENRDGGVIRDYYLDSNMEYYFAIESEHSMEWNVSIDQKNITNVTLKESTLKDAYYPFEVPEYEDCIFTVEFSDGSILDVPFKANYRWAYFNLDLKIENGAMKTLIREYSWDDEYPLINSFDIALKPVSEYDTINKMPENQYASTGLAFGEYAVYSFTPEWSDSYTFASTEDCCRMELYEEEGLEPLVSVDSESGEKVLSQQLQAGKTYYYAIVNYAEYSPKITVYGENSNHKHIFGEWKTIKEASCEEVGSDYRKCEIPGCEVAEVRTVAALGHYYSRVYTIDKPATCEEDGAKSKHCMHDGCEAITDRKIIEKKGHNYSDWEVVKTATCTEDGQRRKICQNCDDVISEVINALDHSMNTQYETITEATCEASGLKYAKCTNPGCTYTEQEEIPALGHEYSEKETEIPATETAAGSRYKECLNENCDSKVGLVVIPMLNSVYSKVEEVAANEEADSEAVQEAVANIIQDSEGNAKTVIDNLNMDTISNLETKYVAMNNSVNASSAKTDIAEIDSKEITVEGAAITAGEYVEEDTATATAVLTINSVEKVEDQKLQDKITEGNAYVLDITLSIKDGNGEQIKEDVQPVVPIRITMPVPEEWQGKDFTLLHYDDDGEVTEIAYEWLGDSTIVFTAVSFSYYAFDVCTHEYEVEESVGVTCEDNGYVIEKCKLCDDRKPTVIETMGHVLEIVPEESKPATCGEAGYDYMKCTNSGCTHTEKIPVAATRDHKYKEVIEEVTCTTAGRFYKECTECGNIIDESVVEAPGHDEEIDEGVAPTCTESGLTQGSHCVECGETLKEQTEIPALGHSYGEWIVDKAATCTADGSKWKECADCGDIEEEVIAAAHGWNTGYTVDKAATCKAAGSKSIHCANCSATKNVTTIAQLAHKWNSGVITTKATCTKAGVKTYTCSSCGGKKTETIKEAGHNYKITKTTKATTKKNGKLAKQCKVCKYKTTQTLYRAKTVSLSKTKFVYNGKTQKPKVVVKDSKGKVISSSNYKVSFSKGCKNAGTYKVTVTFKGQYSGKLTKTFKITKAKQVITASNFTKIKGDKAFYIKAKRSSGGGKLTYKTSNKKIATVSSKGKVTIKKAGKVTITITAAGNKNYNKATKKITITVKRK